MSKTVVICGNPHAIDTRAIVDKINAVITKMNDNEKLAKLTASLPEKKQKILADIILAGDAMRGYLKECERLQRENSHLRNMFNSTPRINIFKRKTILAKIDVNMKATLQNLKFYMNAKSQKEGLEASLERINQFLMDRESLDEYTRNYQYLAENEYNPFVMQLNQYAENHLPLIDPTAEPCRLEPIEVVQQQTSSDEETCTSDENTNQ